MTLATMVLEVAHATGESAVGIQALAVMNWPGHSNFTLTQARLLADLIRRKAESRNQNGN